MVQDSIDSLVLKKFPNAFLIRFQAKLLSQCIIFNTLSDHSFSRISSILCRMQYPPDTLYSVSLHTHPPYTRTHISSRTDLHWITPPVIRLYEICPRHRIFDECNDKKMDMCVFGANITCIRSIPSADDIQKSPIVLWHMYHREWWMHFHITCYLNWMNGVELCGWHARNLNGENENEERMMYGISIYIERVQTAVTYCWVLEVPLLPAPNM